VIRVIAEAHGTREILGRHILVPLEDIEFLAGTPRNFINQPVLA